MGNLRYRVTHTAIHPALLAGHLRHVVVATVAISQVFDQVFHAAAFILSWLLVLHVCHTHLLMIHQLTSLPAL